MEKWVNECEGACRRIYSAVFGFRWLGPIAFNQKSPGKIELGALQTALKEQEEVQMSTHT